MRTLVAAAATVVLAALTSGCSGGGPEGPDDRQSTSPTGDPSPSDSPADPSPGPGDTAVVDSEACEEVRAGIDAFNVGRFDETVEHFQVALPLAEAQDDGSVAASRLVEAVRYYAELEPESYPEASRSSADFATYKAITLGQCVAVAGETSESPDQDV